MYYIIILAVYNLMLLFKIKVKINNCMYGLLLFFYYKR